jgi:hypothetical protein
MHCLDYARFSSTSDSGGEKRINMVRLQGRNTCAAHD